MHRLAMNGQHEGLEHIEALMALRGVEPAYKRKSPIGGGTRRQTREVVLAALSEGVTDDAGIADRLLEVRPDLTVRQARHRVYMCRRRLGC